MLVGGVLSHQPKNDRLAFVAHSNSGTFSLTEKLWLFVGHKQAMCCKKRRSVKIARWFILRPRGFKISIRSGGILKDIEHLDD